MLAPRFGVLFSSLGGLTVGLAYFANPLVRGVLTGIPIVGPALPAPDYLYAFLGAAFVSAALTVGTARLSTTRFDLDSLAGMVTPLDDSPATDGGTVQEGESP